MRTIAKKLEAIFADAALLEMGVEDAGSSYRTQTFGETLEENFIEVAYAEAADYDEIHEALLREHDRDSSRVHPDECQYGDNDLCFI